jgi:hypothetical protein
LLFYLAQHHWDNNPLELGAVEFLQVGITGLIDVDQ